MALEELKIANVLTRFWLYQGHFKTIGLKTLFILMSKDRKNVVEENKLNISRQ